MWRSHVLPLHKFGLSGFSQDQLLRLTSNAKLSLNSDTDRAPVQGEPTFTHNSRDRLQQHCYPKRDWASLKKDRMEIWSNMQIKFYVPARKYRKLPKAISGGGGGVNHIKWYQQPVYSIIISLYYSYHPYNIWTLLNLRSVWSMSQKLKHLCKCELLSHLKVAPPARQSRSLEGKKDPIEILNTLRGGLRIIFAWGPHIPLRRPYHH